MEFTLLWAAITAVVLGWLGLRIWSENLPDRAADRLVAATLIGLAAGRITAMVSQGINPLAHPADLVIIRGGVDTGAAVLGFLITLVWSTRSSPISIDAMAPAVLLALSGWHAGCLWRDACLGTVSGLPWAWALQGGSVTRHPVEIYAALALVAAAWAVSRLGWRTWLRFGTALALASLVRWVSESLRPSIDGGPTGWYLAGILTGVVIATLGPRLTRRLVPDPT
ncbi:MAG: prolipoprotein diacylglyceryl transferase family protein [Acidimicrobiia bacterium]